MVVHTGPEEATQTSVHTVYILFLKILKEESVTTEAGSLSHYLTNLTEKADPLSRVGSCIVEVSSLSVLSGRGKTWSFQHFIGPRKY